MIKYCKQKRELAIAHKVFKVRCMLVKVRPKGRELLEYSSIVTITKSVYQFSLRVLDT